MPAITRHELQSYPCAYCHAKPGDPCRTRLTEVPTAPHQPRWAATFAGRAGDPRRVTAQIVSKLYGEPEPAETFQCQGCGHYLTDPVEADEHKRIHGLVINVTDRPREVRFHFIYNARKDKTVKGRNLWCSCHTRFGEDLDAAQRHLRAAHKIPEWLADLGIRNAIESYIMQQVIDGMLANDEDPTDRDKFVRYRDWLLGGLGQQWVDRLDAS